MSWQDQLDEWKKWRYVSGSSENTIYAQSKYVEKFIGGLPKKVDAGGVTPECVNAWVNADDGKSASTKSFTLAAIKAFFAFLKGKGYCQINPADIVKVNRRKLNHLQKEGRLVKPFTEAEVQYVVDHAPYFYRQATAISWFTGLRLSDICTLEWRSISDTHIVVWTSKRDKRVALPLNHIATGLGSLMPYLKEIRKDDDEFCFPRQKSTIEYPKSRARLSARYSALLAEYGITGRSFHSLRHSFVTRLAGMGISVVDIGQYVGHTDTKTTEGYNHV